MAYRCPYCGKFASYTCLDYDIWQCDNCLCFLSSADFESRAPRQTHPVTTKETIQIVLVVLFICLFLFALAMTGSPQ